eukprot:CAMPEP_0177693584 /NCGR_PEP_ID=MMETSP0484_2-20121128/2477_1 /TAXON_ID=354590 /ORGANISM="Rhodomonas lens, Strain RHODO" /LENGTH=83 /DNA_ID=CAMNT_0019204403 /DNA_START=12 /DNA_END=263 /DNA_ORIENTATION=+
MLANLGMMLAGAPMNALNETASCAPNGFSASDGQNGVNAYSANCGVVYVYGAPGYEPMKWGLEGCPYQPAMTSLPADYVETWQ